MSVAIHLLPNTPSCRVQQTLCVIICVSYYNSDTRGFGPKTSAHGVQFRNYGRTMTVVIQENLSPSACHPFLVANPNLGGQKFEDGRELETAVTRQLETPTDNREQKSWSLNVTNVPTVAGNT